MKHKLHPLGLNRWAWYWEKRLIDLQRLEKGSEKSKTQKPLASNSKLLLLKYIELDCCSS
jgi:hypothetical protein